MAKTIIEVEPILGFEAADLADGWNKRFGIASTYQAIVERCAGGSIFPGVREVMLLPATTESNVDEILAYVLQIARELWGRDAKLPEPQVASFEQADGNRLVLVRQRRSRQ